MILKNRLPDYQFNNISYLYEKFKTQIEKLKKIYSLVKDSSGQSNRIHQSRLLLMMQLFLVFTFFFPSLLFGQKIVVSGLEGIHITEGVTIIEQKSENQIILTTVSYSKKITINNSNRSIKKNNLSAKNNFVSAEKKAVRKNINKKLLKKIKEATERIVVYNTNSKSGQFSSSTSDFLKQGTSNENTYVQNFIKEKNNWTVLLEYYQLKENILFLFYHSKKVEDSLFARPPPVSLS